MSISQSHYLNKCTVDCRVKATTICYPTISPQKLDENAKKIYLVSERCIEFHDAIKMTPNLKTIIIPKCKDSNFDKIIELFENYYPQSVTQVKISYPEKISNFTRLMKAIASPQLESLTIYEAESEGFERSEMKGFFRACPNLKTFRLHGRRYTGIFDIPLHHCKKLERVKLRYLVKGVTQNTFESLKQCQSLQRTTFISYDRYKQLMRFLVNPHGLNLTALHLSQYTPQPLKTNYELFKLSSQLPNLEEFVYPALFQNSDFTDETLSLLSYYCPRLTKLVFPFRNISDQGFEKFIKNLKEIQYLDINDGNHLATKALRALGKYCPQLKKLSLLKFKDISCGGLKAIADGCTKLEQLKIWVFDRNPFSTDGFEYLLNHSKSLKVVEFCDLASMNKYNIKKDKFPLIKWGCLSSFEKQLVLEKPKEKAIRNRPLPALSKDLLNEYLREAARYNNLPDIQKFIRLGADLNTPSFYNTGGYGYIETPLTIAAASGNLEALIFLQSSGANINQVAPILGDLTQPEHLPILKYLLEEGLDPNAENEIGFTPLQVMAKKAFQHTRYLDNYKFHKIHTPNVQILIDFGADVEIRTPQGVNLLDFAIDSNNTNLVEFLRKKINLKEEFPIPDLEKFTRAELKKLEKEYEGYGLERKACKFGSTVVSRHFGLSKEHPDDLISKKENPVSKVLPKEVFPIVEKIISKKRKRDNLTTIADLKMSKGVYCLKSTSVVYKSDESFLKKLKDRGKDSVIALIEEMEPYYTIIIRTTDNIFYRIDNIDGFEIGKSIAKKIPT